jgi:hypothetical protein
MSAIDAIEQDIADLFIDPFALPDNLTTLARQFVEARIAKETAEAVLKEANDLVMRAEAALGQAMKSNGMTSMTIEVGGQKKKLVSTQTMYYSLPPGALDDEAIREWLELSGGVDIIKNTVHHSTFSSFCKEIVEKAAGEGYTGSVLHPAVKTAVRSGIQLRKG